MYQYIKVTGYSYVCARTRIIIYVWAINVLCTILVQYTKTANHNYSTTSTKYTMLFFTSVFSQGIELLTVYTCR